MKIISAPNPVLSQISKPVLQVNSYILNLIEEMKKTLLSAKDPVGVGLAAPQVGKSVSLFIIKPTVKSPISVFINPKITFASSAKSSEVSQSERTKNLKKKSGISDNKMLEGCLSLPTIWGEVQRSAEITLKYQLITKASELITKTHAFSGFPAIIIQHEVDHLNGILFPKRVLEQKGKLYKSVKDKKGEDVFEEIEL